MKPASFPFRRGVSALIALAALLSVRAQAAADAPVPSITSVCPADSIAEPPATLDYDTEFARVEALQVAQDPQMLPVGCRAWAYALKHGPAVQVIRAQANVGSSLLWQRRPVEARALLADAYPQLLATQPPRWADAAETAGLLGAYHYQRNEVDAALLWTQRGIDAAAQPGSGIDARSLLRLRMNLGELLSGMRKLAEAESLVDGLLEQTRGQQPEFAFEQAALMHTRALLLMRQDRIEEGMAAARAEIAFRQDAATSDKVGLALALQNLGTLLTTSARYDEAEAALRDAIRAGSAGGTDLWAGLAGAYESLSRLLLQRGRTAQALDAARQAVALLDAGPEGKAPRAARPLRYLAQAQLASGDVGGALDTLRRGLALLDSGQGRTDTDTEWALRLEHLRVLLALGDLAAAQEASERAAAMMARLPLGPSDRAALLAAQAAVAHRRGDEAAAQTLLAEADAALSSLFTAGHPQRIALQIQRCAWWGRDCSTLAALANASGLPGLRARAALALSLQAATGKGGSGKAREQAAVAISAALEAAAPDLQWQAESAYFAALAAEGRRTEAIFFGKLALGVLQGLRDSVLVLGPNAEAQYLADKGELYRGLAAELLSAGRVPEALEVLALLKRSEQNDFNERAAAVPTQGLNLTPQEQAWQRSFDAVGAAGRQQASELEALRRLAAAQRLTSREAARLQQLQAGQAQARLAVEAQLEAVLAELRQTAGAKSAALGASQLPRHARPRDAQTLYVYFVSGPDRLSLLAVGPRGQQIQHLPLPASALATQVGTLLDAVRKQDAVMPQAQALYQAIGRSIDRAARQQGATRIVFWLDGALRYLPPGLLHDGRQFLAERYALSIVGGPTSAAQPAALSQTRLPQIHAWGVTLPLAGLPALPGVGAELCGIVDGPLRGLSPGADRILHCSGALPGEADANAYFTAEALSAAGPTAQAGSFVHIGTHFVLRPGNVSKSWLLLGDGSRLTLDRMHELSLGTPRLLTLSACETAVPGGVDADGRELEGLAGTLLGQGAEQVMASLWRVDDPSTAQLMHGIYEALARQPGDVPAALQRAQQAAIQAGLPSRAWAAFVVLQPAPR